MHSPHPDTHAASPTRRGVLRAAAWSVPAVSLAAAAPAYAVSLTGPGDVVTLELASQEWGRTGDPYLYVELRVRNLSASQPVLPGLTVTLSFAGPWTNGTLVDIDPGRGGLNASWGPGWTSPSNTAQRINGTATRSVVRTLPLAAGSVSTIAFRVRRQALVITRPYGATVGAAIVLAPGRCGVADESLRSFSAARRD